MIFSSVCICHVKGLIRAVRNCMSEKLFVRLTSMKEHWTFLSLTFLPSFLSSTALMCARPFLLSVHFHIHHACLLFPQLYLSRARGIFQAGTTRGQSRIRNTRAHPGSVLHPGVRWTSGPAGQQRSQFTHYRSRLQLIAITSQKPLFSGKSQHLQDMKLKAWQCN